MWCFHPRRHWPYRKPCRPQTIKLWGPSTFLYAPSSRTQNTATPLGLHHPLENASNTTYSALSTLTFVYYCLTSCIAHRPPLCSYAYQGSPLNLVRRKIAVINTFQNWLDTFTAYVLLIITVHPARTLELIRYQQTISKAVTKFKGPAWLTYNEQFTRHAAYSLWKP